MFVYLKESKYNRINFYLSGIVSFFIYILFCLLILLYIKSQDVKKFDAISKVTVLELEVIIQNNKQKDIKAIETTIDSIDTKISQQIVKKSTSSSAKKTSDIKSLFSKFKIEEKIVAKEKLLNIEKGTVTSRFKSKFEKQKKSQNITVSKLLDKVQPKSYLVVATNTKEKNDLYFSKIYRLLSVRWNPTVFDHGLWAEVLVMISNKGKFNYVLMRSSGNRVFDEALIDFLEKQKMISYPSHDSGLKQEITVTFKAEKG